MFKFLACIIIVWLSGLEISIAQKHFISGWVIDSLSRQPVEEVIITSPSFSATYLTSSKGYFSIPLNKKGAFEISFVHAGYNEAIHVLSTDFDSVEIELCLKNTDLEAVEVTARKRTSPLKEVTMEPLAWQTSITKISSRDIDHMGALTTLDALKYSTNGLPSVQGRRKKYYYLLRGQNVSADYAINGVSLSTNGSGPMAQWVEAPSMLPANMIESVEVVRSGNSLLLGFSGLNGVVNIKTKKFENFETQAENSYGTFNTSRVGIVHGGKIRNFNYALSFFNDRTDGPKGRHSYENLWNIYGKIGYQYKNLIELNIENFYTYGTRFVTQAVDYKGLALPQRQLSEIWEYDPMRYNIFLVRVKINESVKTSTELQFAYILNRMDLYPDAYEFSVDPNTQKSVVGDSIIRAHMLNEPDSILSLGVFQVFTPFKNNVFRIASMYANSANYAHGKSKKAVGSVALLDQQTLGNWDLHAGAKFIREYYVYYVPNQGFGDENKAIQNEWQPVLVNISAGASYTLNEKLICNGVLNSGTLPADNTSLQLNSDGSTGPLKQEKRTGLDLGIEYRLPDWGNWMFTLFMLNQKNASDFTNRAYYDDDDQIRYYEKNISLQTCGLEVSYQSPDQWTNWMIFGNTSYKYIRQNENSIYKKFAKQPPFITNLGISYMRNGWNVSLMGKYVSDYKTDRFLKQEVWAGNYFNWDLNADYLIPKAKLQVFGCVMNVFDVRYYTVSPIYPDFGRQIKIGIRYGISGKKNDNQSILNCNKPCR